MRPYYHNIVDEYLTKVEFNGFPPISKDDGFVYVIFNDITKLTKIGITTQPKRRLQTIRSSGGTSITPLLLIHLEWRYDPNDYAIESFLHKFFKDKRKKGEWFDLNLQEILSIRDLFYGIEGWDIMDNIPEWYKKHYDNNYDTEFKGLPFEIYNLITADSIPTILKI